MINIKKQHFALIKVKLLKKPIIIVKPIDIKICLLCWISYKIIKQKQSLVIKSFEKLQKNESEI
jgi:hypothetical protein